MQTQVIEQPSRPLSARRGTIEAPPGAISAPYVTPPFAHPCLSFEGRQSSKREYAGMAPAKREIEKIKFSIGISQPTTFKKNRRLNETSYYGGSYGFRSASLI